MSESNTSMSSISWLYSCSPITSTSSGSSKLTMLALTFLRRFPRWKRCTCLVARSNTPYNDDDDDTDIVDTDIVDTDIADTDIADTDIADEDIVDEDIVDEDIVDKDIVDTDIVDKDADDADVNYRDVDHNYSLKCDIYIYSRGLWNCISIYSFIVESHTTSGTNTQI